MSFTQPTNSTPDAATQTLWHAAEVGNVDELLAVLPRVRDINARNEHGVTALMRAAQNGRLRVVRVLLEHGADANIIRNDKFTALALAAFFGHTEIVRALMEHGADSQASTRNDTSPHMWATARTFNRVANELENPAPPINRPAPRFEKRAALYERPSPPKPKEPVAPFVRPVTPPVARTTVVRTLKDPPEIWDLVHPEPPRQFTATSAFVARLSSMRRGFAFRAVMVAVLAGVCAVGVWVLRGAQARSVRSSDRPLNAARPDAKARGESTSVDRSSQPATVISPGAELTPSATLTPGTGADSSAVAPEVAAAPGDASATTGAISDKPVFSRRPNWRSSRVGSSGAEETRVAASDVSQPAAEPVAAPSQAKTGAQPGSKRVTTSKNSASLSPQLIAPAKSATPKPKVIQWP